MDQTVCGRLRLEINSIILTYMELNYDDYSSKKFKSTSSNQEKPSDEKCLAATPSPLVACRLFGIVACWSLSHKLEHEDCAVVQEGYFHSVGTFVQTGTGLYISIL